MIRAFFAATMAISAMSSSPVSAQPSATVVVTFDGEAARPLIVEGIANRETGRPIESNDPVRVASISKLIMALATFRLVKEGKVDLDADVSDYLGWTVRSPNYPNAKVTLAQLLSHRSGLRDAAGYVIPLGESLKAKIADPEAWHADAPPGEAPFEYANLGSPVVATVLEAATGERYDRLLERTVFAPLGIEACLNWIGCSEEQAAKVVTLYRSTGEVARDDVRDLPPNCTIPVADGMDCSLENYTPGTNASIFSPQGGVRIGMMDLAKIGNIIANRGRGFLDEDFFVTEVLNAYPQTEGQDFFCAYGLGFQWIERHEDRCTDRLVGDGLARIGHAGEAYGLRSGLWVHPASKTGYAYFTTAVPDRSSEDEGGFDTREIDLFLRASKGLEQSR